MTKKKTPAKKSSKKGLFIGLGAGALAIILIVVAMILNSTPKKYDLDPLESLKVSYVRLEVSIDKLNGGGKVSTSDCEIFRTLAKAYDPSTDWFKSSYCSYIMYADYDDTEKEAVVTLSDGAHAAVYTFDSDLDYLLGYKFIESTTKGRSLTIDND